MEWIPLIRGRVPFGVVDRPAAGVTTRVLRDFPHHSPLTLEKLNFSIGLAFETIGWILMRTNKIGGYFVTFAVIYEVFYPFAFCCSGTTDTQRGVHVLDGLGRITKELEVIALRACPK